MAVRLMFSTATAITPELLVLDEVLGVGDAYFAQKSYERMRELTEGAGSTLLLVTHDIYSAVKLCTRIIWIDRGRVLMDGDGPVVIKVRRFDRQQEELRLRLRKQQRLMPIARRPPNMLIEIQSAGNRSPAAPVFFGRVEVSVGDRMVSLLDEAAFDETRRRLATEARRSAH
jgi:ABC-type glutathione transport system ATPase component